MTREEALKQADKKLKRIQSQQLQSAIKKGAEVASKAASASKSTKKATKAQTLKARENRKTSSSSSSSSKKATKTQTLKKRENRNSSSYSKATRVQTLQARALSRQKANKSKNEKRSSSSRNTERAKGTRNFPKSEEFRTKVQKTQLQYPVYRAIAGVTAGLVGATTGIDAAEGNELVKEAVKDSKAYSAGKAVGNIAAYAIGYGSAGGAAGKAASKVIASATGKKAVSKMAKSKLFKAAAKKTLQKQGQNATKKAIEHTAKKQATKVAKGIVKGAVTDATLGTVLDSNTATSEGAKLGSKEWRDTMVKNAAINAATGGAVELAPTVARAVSKTVSKKSAKTAAKKVAKTAVTTVKKADDTAAAKLAKETAEQASETAQKREIKTVKASGKYKAPTPKNSQKSRAVKTIESNLNGQFVDTGSSIQKNISNSSALEKDLGADIYKKSTQKLNASKYGTERGVVNATPYGETSQTARTLYNSPMLDEKAKKKLQRDINEGLYAKYTKKNDTSISNATARINDNIDTAYNDFKAVTRNGSQATSEDIALGYKLAETYQNNGDYKKMMDVIADIASMESETGRTLQAMRMFNNLTPEGRVKSTMRNISSIEKKTNTKIEVPEELIQKLANSTSEQEINAVKKAINTEIWNQVPANWVDKVNAWRYMSMLANPKTHVRNLLGNAIFVPVKGIRNYLASALERVIVPKGERTKAILTFRDKNLVKLGKEDFEKVKDVLTGNSRYIEGARDLDSKIFKNKALEKLRKLNSDMLENEDALFLGYSYRRSYAQYLKANGYTASTVTEKIAEKAREYATKEALNSTYRDVSTLADSISRIKKYAKMKTSDIPVGNYNSEELAKASQRWKKAAGIAVEATMPFTKTPINILKRGVDYSPISIARGIGNIIRANGDPKKLVKGITDISSGLTGTSIMAIGTYMGYQGMSTGSLDTSSDEGQYNKMLGEQEYSIRIGDYTYTFDWAVPVAMPFFVGTEIGNYVRDNGISFANAMDALTKLTDPVFNLSMLSGLNTVLGDTYSSIKDGNAMIDTVKNMGQSYIGQLFPTIGGQIARTITPETKTTTSINQNKNFQDYERFGRQLLNKIPFLNQYNEPYVNLWGEKETKQSREDYLRSAFENFLSPGYIKSTKKSDVDKEILRLAEKFGASDRKSLFPENTKPSDAYMKFDDIEYIMNEKELATYKINRGKYAKEKLDELFKSKKYANMSNEEKKEAIQQVYKDAEDEADKAFLIGRGKTKGYAEFVKLSSDVRARQKDSGLSKERFAHLYNSRTTNGGSMEDAKNTLKMIKAGAETYKEANAVSSISPTAWNRAMTAYNAGLTDSMIEKVGKGADYDGNGSYTNKELTDYLNSHDFTQEEKRALFRFFASWNAHNPY